MTEKESYLLIAGILTWIIIAIIASVRANRYFTISKKRLILNLTLIWIIPFLWAILILLLTSKTKDKKKDGYKYHEAGYSNYTKWGG